MINYFFQEFIKIAMPGSPAGSVPKIVHGLGNAAQIGESGVRFRVSMPKVRVVKMPTRSPGMSAVIPGAGRTKMTTVTPRPQSVPNPLGGTNVQ